MVQTFPDTNLKFRRTTYLSQVEADRFQQNFFPFQRFSNEPSMRQIPINPVDRDWPNPK